MTESNESAVSAIRAWLETTKGEPIPAGLPVNEALRRAGELRDSLRAESASPNSYELTAENTEVLHAVCASIREEPADPRHVLAEAARAYAFVESVVWPEEEPYGGRQELLADLAFTGWRAGRRANKSAEAERWLRRYSASHLSTVAGSMASRILSDLVSEGPGTSTDPELHNPQVLLSLLEVMRSRIKSDPRAVRAAATLVTSSIDGATESIGQRDEREYFLDELGLIAGGACRLLFDREAARPR